MVRNPKSALRKIFTDFGWPQGDYRDIWNLDPPQSHVVWQKLEYARKRLASVEKDITGPAVIEFTSLTNPTVAMAGKIGSEGNLVEDSTGGI